MVIEQLGSSLVAFTSQMPQPKSFPIRRHGNPCVFVCRFVACVFEVFRSVVELEAVPFVLGSNQGIRSSSRSSFPISLLVKSSSLGVR
jgi:hypothetical protein